MGVNPSPSQKCNLTISLLSMGLLSHLMVLPHFISVSLQYSFNQTSSINQAFSEKLTLYAWEWKEGIATSKAKIRAKMVQSHLIISKHSSYKA